MNGHEQKPTKKFLLDHKPHPAHSEEGEGNWLVSYADMMTLLVGFFVILMSFSTMDAAKFKEAQKSVSEKFGGELDQPYKELYEKIKAELDKANLGDAVEIKEADNGVSISFSGTVFFDLGSADVKPEANQILQKLVPVIKAQAQGFNVLVEGHTDDVPISNGVTYRTNWELSSVRACRVLDFFESFGFAKTMLNAVGLADTRPKVPNKNPDGTPNLANRAKNRRVVIKILKGAENIFFAEK